MNERLLLLIENIRRRPEHTRWVILAVITAACAVLLVTLWGWNLTNQFSRVAPRENEKKTELLGFFASIQKSWQALRSGEEIEPIAEEVAAETEAAAASGWTTRWGAVVSQSFAAVSDAVWFNVRLIGQALADLF